MKTIITTETSRISISAHYTGYVWYKYGLSQPHFVTPLGRLANLLFTPLNKILQAAAGGNIDTFLLQRHLLLDHLLTALIEQQGIEQIVELAAGLSPRGFRLTQRYPQLSYIETDLSAMAARKQQLLATLPCNPQHQVQVCDILSHHHEHSLEAVLARLDQSKKTLVISEGLINYFPLSTIHPVWTRLSTALQAFPQAYYLTDLYPDLNTHPAYRYVKVAQKLVEVFTRGSWPLHYHNDTEIEQGFLSAGFKSVRVHNPSLYQQQLKLPPSRNQSLVRLIVAQA